MISGLGILLSFGLLMLFTAGCAPSQKEIMAKDQVNRARKAYSDAYGNPIVEAYAPIQLQDASKAVQAAEKAEELDDMIQLGYIAERKSQLAATVAEAKAAEREMDKLNVEKAQLFARKQAVEAEQARREAEKALGEAQQARMQATSETEKAMIAKRQAELARRQAEQATLAAQTEAEKAARARAEAEQLSKEVSDLKAKQTERGIVLTIGDVLFATGKANLSTQANVSVNKLADFLKKHPTRNVLIEGHTDSVGSDEYNQVLSGKRADSVKYALVNDGIEADRITTVGYGEKYPVTGNDNPAGRAQNRRVDVIILNEGVDAQTQIRK
jgi:outer membrane protein OmpA-like peptidoglycan-associated protein